MNTLYVNSNPLDVMEQMSDKKYDYVYIDLPYNRSDSSFFQYKQGGEKLNIEYGEYISRIIENASRIVRNDGIVCILADPSITKSHNTQLIVEHYFSSIMVITINNLRPKPWKGTLQSHLSIFCCNTQNNYCFEDYREKDMDEKKYPYKDKQGRNYRITPLFTMMKNSLHNEEKFLFRWNGLIPPDKKRWALTEDRVIELASDDRIEIRDGKPYKKIYQDESFVSVTSVWDNKSIRSTLSEEIYCRLLKMFTQKEARVLCPFERDGMFTYCANKNELQWDSVFLPFYKHTMIDRIERQAYSVKEIREGICNYEYQRIAKSVDDIKELEDEVDQLRRKIYEVQIDNIEYFDEEQKKEIIEKVVNRIHELIIEQDLASKDKTCEEEAREWITPYWEKLEELSKIFIPSGESYIKNAKEKSVNDCGGAVIEYCKALEHEIFEKMFRVYIEDLLERGCDVKKVFKEDLYNKDTKRFVEFLDLCVSIHPSNPEEWRFELGNMAYVLTRALAKKPKTDVMIDFRKCLERFFESEFFNTRFQEELFTISDIRNKCAHRNVVNYKLAVEGKEMIRQKLNSILAYYN